MKILLALYLTFQMIIMLFDFMLRESNPALYVTFAFRASMSITVLSIRKRYLEQDLIALAFAFTVTSDYYFIFVNTFDKDIPNSKLFGMIGFVGAFLCLILTFSRNFRIGKSELITIAPFSMTFAFLS